MPVLEARHLFKVFGSRSKEAVKRLRAGDDPAVVSRELDVTAAVIDAGFSVEQGEIFVVMGLSGSGKSTLIRMLNGLHSTSSGEVLVHGKDIARMNPADLRAVRRDHISMVFQHFALLPHRTVLENAEYALKIKGVDPAERSKRAREALAMVDLEGQEDRLPAQLSGGMQQRVGLARALAADTDILLMDEAFSALDPLIRRDMQDQLLTLQSKLGKTIIFITHDLNEAMRLGDRIAMMRHGKIVQIGTAEQILTDPANDYVAQFVADVDRARVFNADAIMEKPVATIGEGSGARAAHRTLRENQVPGLFVVSRDRKLVGYVLDDDVAGLKDQPMRDVMHPIELAVPRHTPAAELFTPSAENRLPLPVVDDDGRLVGVIPRVTLLSKLGAGTTAHTNSEEDIA
ncbi:quaternary amine ABC transporter ATP-binding protein [Calidifontibacter terrae]